MIRALYDRTLALAAHRHATGWLAGVSFVESSVFPVPPDVMLIPMAISQRHRAFFFALVCTLASVAGGLAGYGIGALLWEAVGQPIIDFYGYRDAFESFQGRFNDYGAWAVLIAGLTPFPFKVITLASGVTGLNIGIFVLCSVVARAARFYLVAGLIWKFGAPVQAFIEKRLGLLTAVFMILLVGGFVAIKYL